jgi:hypothetical protein
MKRHLMTKLISWKDAPRRKPLILRGVRQTGKTYLLTQFGQTQFNNVHVVNFEKQINLSAVFNHDLDPRRIIDDLSFELNTKINIDHDLVIFDEIQACPKALTSLKYFCEDLPELALCSAGSLLGLHLNESSYPVGKVDMMNLYPMTFTEFLEGIGDHLAAELVHTFTPNTQISTLKHAHMWDRLKQYFITGGLPEVVYVFSEQQQSLFDATTAVRLLQEQLIKAYYADIAKHAGKVNAMHIDRTWQAVPLQLANNYDTSVDRFRFKEIIPTISRYRQLVSVIDWLEEAELIIRVPIVGSFEHPLKAYSKENLFKLMMFDVGLLGAMNPIDPSAILSYDYGTYKGYFAENFVAQQLSSHFANTLYCWQENRSEVEFLLPYRSEVIPIEVKAGKITKAQSLQKHIDKYKPKRSFILSANPPHLNQRKTVFHLPLYLVEKISSLLEWGSETE